MQYVWVMVTGSDYAVYVLQVVPGRLRDGQCHDPHTVFAGQATATVTAAAAAAAAAGDATMATFYLEVNASAPINFTLSVTHHECLFLDEAAKAWDDANCSVSPATGPGMLRCSCNHLTVFGGTQGKGALVKPNMVQIRVITADDIGNNAVVFVPVLVLLDTA